MTTKPAKPTSPANRARNTVQTLQRTETRSNQEFQRALYRLRRSPLSMIGLVMVVFIILVALLGPIIVPFPADATGTTRMKDRMRAPDEIYVMGTDDVGRDVFSRTVLAAQTSLIIALVVLGIAILIGLPLGAIAGYMGGWIDEIIMRITDVFMTVPALLLAMAMAAALGAGMVNAMLAIALVWWPGYTRLVRGQVLSLREQDFVEAGRALGANRWHILWRHVIPNLISSVIIKASLDMGFAILVTAGLGYIGVGVQAPTPEWGVMISEGRGFLREAWWISVYPGLAMFITVLGFNLLGDGLRDIFDPKTRR